jgi:ATP-dependent DNA helicase RecQ
MEDLKVSVGGVELELTDIKVGEEVAVSTTGTAVTAHEIEEDSEPEETKSPLSLCNEVKNTDLFSKLVILRRELAREHSVPPYVIFNDKSLREMTEKLPLTLDDFSRINGVGDSKLMRYGDVFTEVIKEYLDEAV